LKERVKGVKRMTGQIKNKAAMKDDISTLLEE
jgi:hypothetical protein